jgi:hypothetical protein
MRARAAAWTFAAALAALLPSHAFAGPWRLAPGEYYSQLDGTRSTSNSTYDADGTRTRDPLALERRALNVYNELGWKKWGSIILSAPIRSATLHSTSLAFDRTETGLGDIGVGLGIPVLRGRTAVALQGLWTAPLGYQTVTAPTLGPGKQNMTGTLAAGTGFPTFNAFVEADGGYRYWFNRFASQLVGSARAGWWLGSSVLVLAHYNIEHANTEAGKEAIDQQTVGPELRYRVDDRFDMIAGSNHSASGKNVRHSDEYYVGVAYRQTKLDHLQGLIGGKH